MSASSILRFAPSPNGELHLGHALSALLNFDAAMNSGGKFLLRIEDIDIGRRRDAFVDGIMRDLAWLGLGWPQPVLFQSSRLDCYREAAARLTDMGLLYPCFATRTEIAAAASPGKCDPDGAPLYPQLHKGLSAQQVSHRKAAGLLHAMRIDMARAVTTARKILGTEELCFIEVDAAGGSRSQIARPERWGDAVILRKDVPASYHLAVVLDDAHQNVTHVIRGQDLAAATDIHRLLQVLLKLPSPYYHHHRLILGDDGRKLAKSSSAHSLRMLRESGSSAQDIRSMVGLG